MSSRWVPLVGLLVLVIGAALVFGRPEPDRPQDGLAYAAVGSRTGWDSLVVPGVPESVPEFMRNGQSWRAARAMRAHLDAPDARTPDAVLLAVRAEAGWGGWDRVSEYLEGRDWLDRSHDGEGWYWLARARGEEERWGPALEAYDRFLARLPDSGADERRRIAELRRALVLLRLGQVEQGVAALASLREHAPEIAPRVAIVAAEALAGRGDTAGVRTLAGEGNTDELRRRGALALLEAYERAGDQAGRLALARRSAAEAGSGSVRAALGVEAARAALALGDRAAAAAELRSVLRASPGSSAARTAAGLLADLPGLDAADRLAIAEVLDRHGANREAAGHYRAWLAAGAGSEGARRGARVDLGKALFDAGDYTAAVAALRPVVDASGAPGATAMLLTGRAQYRSGNRSAALATFDRLAARHPRSEQGSEGLFLVADLAHDAREVARARRLYRRVASEFPGTDRAGLSLMRLGGLAWMAGDMDAAAQAWEEYRSRYPSGERWLESTYWAGRSRERAGERDAAAERYRAIRSRDPLSYYALRAAQRLDETYWPVPMGESPAADPAAERRVAEWMRGIDLLREAGMHDEAEAEADRYVEAAGDDRTLLYPLAEMLNERGYTVRGIRIGLRLQREAQRPNPRLLRVVYPFPYRPMLEAEAREKELDPFLVAALIRQESLFKARIASPVGARGLMQLMPETGRGMAAGAGISNWDVELLYQPEINAHLGTRFLADQMRAWRGSLPSVFSAYNAGPHRVERWREYPEYADEELFTERIPYRETREYVKILTRNAAVYRGLYGE